MPLARVLRFPVLLEDLLFKPQNSLVVQGQHSHLGATTTNGDGFGVGWYGALRHAGAVPQHRPVWNDRNLRELCAHAQAGRVLAHIRASTGSAVQQTNCHPFRHGRWLWMHNGSLAGFREMKRDLAMAVDPALFPDIEGSTDSEMFFFLALTFGLRDDPPAGVARAVGLIEDVGRRARHRVPGADDGRDHRRRHDLGVPLLQRGQVALAVPEHRRLDAARCSTRTTPCCTSCPTTPASWCPSRSATCSGAWRRGPRVLVASSCTALEDEVARRSPPSRRPSGHVGGLHVRGPDGRGVSGPLRHVVAGAGFEPATSGL